MAEHAPWRFSIIVFGTAFLYTILGWTPLFKDANGLNLFNLGLSFVVSAAIVLASELTRFRRQ